MQHKFSYIYESAQNDHFERSIMSGHLTESKLLDMINNNELSESQITIAEGLFDRLRSRGSQAVNAVRGAGQQIAGGAKQMAGNALAGAGNLAAKGVQAVGGNIDPSQNKLVNQGQQMSAQGAAQSQQGAEMGGNAKVQSYLTNTVSTIINDLKSLNIPVADAAALSRELSQVLVRHVKGTATNLQQGANGPSVANQQTPQFAPQPTPRPRRPNGRVAGSLPQMGR